MCVSEVWAQTPPAKLMTTTASHMRTPTLFFGRFSAGGTRLTRKHLIQKSQQAVSVQFCPFESAEGAEEVFVATPVHEPCKSAVLLRALSHVWIHNRVSLKASVIDPFG